MDGKVDPYGSKKGESKEIGCKSGNIYSDMFPFICILLICFRSFYSLVVYKLSLVFY